jgi:hypothetical protein
VKILRLMGSLVGWVQIVLYGLFLVAGAAALFWVAYRQSHTGTIVLVVTVAVIGAIAYLSNRLPRR